MKIIRQKAFSLVEESSLKQRNFGLLTLAALPIGAGAGAVAGGAIGSNITRRDPNQKDIAYEIERLSKMKKALMNSKSKQLKGETVGKNFYNRLVNESYDAADLLDQTLVGNDSYIIGDDDSSCDNSNKARQQYTKAIDQSIKTIDSQIAKTKKDGPTNWSKDYASHGAKLGALVGVATPIVASALTPDHIKRPIKKGIGIALGTGAALGTGYLAYKHYKNKKEKGNENN